MWRCTSLLVVLFLVSISGCGGNGPYGTKKVNGTILYDDGSLIPADRIELRFISQEPPVDTKTYPKQGLVDVEVTDGTFSDVSTYVYGDGIIKGKHKIAAMSLDAKNAPTTAIPPEFNSPDTSTLEIDSSQTPFKLVIPKPRKK